MKRILLTFIIILFIFSPIYNLDGVFSEENKQVKVITECNLYKEAKVNYTEDDGILLTLQLGEILEIKEEPIKGKDSEFYFYNILIRKDNHNYEGYVITNFVTSTMALKRNIDPNAKTLNQSQIYTLPKDDNKLSLAGENIVLERYKEIKIIDGYDKSKEFHQIMFEIDGEIYIGYIKTSDLLIEGFNASIVLVVFIFILVALIALSIWKTTRKKRKRQNVTNNM